MQACATSHCGWAFGAGYISGVVLKDLPMLNVRIQTSVKHLYSSKSLFSIYVAWAIEFTRVIQEMESRCTDSLSLGGSGKHASIFSLLLLILMFQYAQMKRLQSAHALETLWNLNSVKTALISEWIQAALSEGIPFVLPALYFCSAFLHLSASSCSDPLTGNSCRVSQLCLTQLSEATG